MVPLDLEACLAAGVDSLCEQLQNGKHSSRLEWCRSKRAPYATWIFTLTGVLIMIVMAFWQIFILIRILIFLIRYTFLPYVYHSICPAFSNVAGLFSVTRLFCGVAVSLLSVMAGARHIHCGRC